MSEETELAVDLLTLRIDESFELDTEVVINKNLVFQEGEYLFDTNLGNHGGIRINLQ